MSVVGDIVRTIENTLHGIRAVGALTAAQEGQVAVCLVELLEMRNRPLYAEVMRGVTIFTQYGNQTLYEYLDLYAQGTNCARGGATDFADYRQALDPGCCSVM